MSRTIWKYRIGFLQTGFAEVLMPKDARIVAVGNEGADVVAFWAEHETDERLGTVTRSFQVLGTGHPIPEGLIYVGTTQTVVTSSLAYGQHSHHPGPVWHLFEVPRG